MNKHCFAAATVTVSLICSVPLLAGNVVTEWNTIASATIVKGGGKGSTPSGVWFAYTSIAVYDAVNSITGTSQPFYLEAGETREGSPEAAAAAAAHRILVNYFPAQQAMLDAKFAASLSMITGDQHAKEQGVAAGEASAAALISARTGDGLEANVPYTPGNGDGAWIPTPPAYLAPLAPWLGQMRPFTMGSAAEFLPRGPSSLSSEQWKRDYNLVRLYGASNSMLRSTGEKEIGLFWTEHTGQQYARAFGYLADSYQLNVPETARLMAILWTGYADAVIGCFNAKYKFGFWRPVTAISAGGGNPELSADPAWLPLGTTPNHPEYPAAHGCITGAVSTLIAGYFHTTDVQIQVDSKAFQDGIHTHTFTNTDALFDEVFWSRIYAGFHYFNSLKDGGAMGEKIAQQLLKNHFQPRRLNGESSSRRNGCGNQLSCQ